MAPRNRHPPAPSKINPKAVENSRPQKVTINEPRFTTNPPQIHHQKATFNHPFLPKPPAKTTKPSPKKIRAKMPTMTKFVVQSPDGTLTSDGTLFNGMMTRINQLGVHGFRAVLWHQ